MANKAEQWLILSPSRSVPQVPMYWVAGNHWHGEPNMAARFASEESVREQIAFARLQNASAVPAEYAIAAKDWAATLALYDAIKAA